MPSKTKPILSLEEIKKIPCQIAKIIFPKTSQPFGTVVVWERKKIGKHGILLFLLATSGVCLETHEHTSELEKERVKDIQ